MSAMLSPKKKKRKPRTILSCMDCRRRKLKCDRGLPCNRCVAGGYAEACMYGEGMRKRIMLSGDGGVCESEDAPTHARGLATPLESGDNETTPATSVMRGEACRPLFSGDDAQRGVQTGDDDCSSRIEALEQQIRELREVVWELRGESRDRDRYQQRDVGNAACEVAEKEAERDWGLFKGKGYGTFYYGASSSIAIIAHFPALRPFMKRIFTNSALQTLRTKAPHPKVPPKHVNSVLTIPNLHSLLPDRETADELVKLYFSTFESTYRILHAPSFWKAYSTFWDAVAIPTDAQSQRSDINNSDTHALLLGILAVALTARPDEANLRYNRSGSSWRTQAVVWIRACEAWLRASSNKRRSLASVQVRLLRILALSTTCLKTKTYYTEVQSVAAFMVSAGMHREPGVLRARCGVFEGEMRRRLWASMRELEMQASVDRGLPSTLAHLPADICPPLNLNDTALHPNMTSLPRSQPSHIFTDTSYLHLSAPSYPLRTALLTSITALSPLPNPNPTSNLAQEESITRAINAIPRWTAEQAQIPMTLLSLQLQQFLLLIHQRTVLSAAYEQEQNTHPITYTQSTHALTAVLSTSESIITSHTHLANNSLYLLTLLRLDYLRAALLISHITFHLAVSLSHTTPPTATPLPSNAADSSAAATNKALRQHQQSGSGSHTLARLAYLTFESTRDRALSLVEERCKRSGRGGHLYWYVSAAVGLVEVQWVRASGGGGSEGEERRLEGEATGRVCGVLLREMALREEGDGETEVGVVVLGYGGGSGGAGLAVDYGDVDVGVGVGVGVDVDVDAGLAWNQTQAQMLGQGLEQGLWGMDDFWFCDVDIGFGV